MSNGNWAAAGAVFVQTNDAEANRVLVFRRDDEGRLSPAESVASGGRGDGVPHLTSQGSVVLSGDGRYLLVTNAGSDDLSVLTVGDGEPSLVGLAPSGGAAPKSVTEHGGLVFVLNAGAPSVVGFELAEGRLERLPDARRELAAEADPAQVGFTPDGSRLIVTDRGTNAIVAFPVGQNGRLGDPDVVPSSGPTPYGFAFSEHGVLVVTEAFGAERGKAAASSYKLRNGSVEPVSRSIGNGRSEICWAVVTADGRYVFATNFADGAVSRYRIDDDGSIALEDAVAATAVAGRSGLRDEDLTADGRFLYAIDADGGRIFGWAVDGGELSPVGAWPGIPTTVAGLAAT